MYQSMRISITYLSLTNLGRQDTRPTNSYKTTSTLYVTRRLAMKLSASQLFSCQVFIRSWQPFTHEMLPAENPSSLQLSKIVTKNLHELECQHPSSSSLADDQMNA
eukprot:TRINITY_DN423_c0_g2_i2.p1 TRINITY_DN423_c0_g2~~TRINITY_DN423_c0_g2_i2.p1  ORF type:complete len:106 (-),score=2.07 TRINITY_DN423_c0_g2_i2:350-667(-)